MNTPRRSGHFFTEERAEKKTKKCFKTKYVKVFYTAN